MTSAAENESTAEVGDYPDFTGRDLNIVTFGGAWTDAIREYYAEPFSEATGANVNFVVSGTDPIATVQLQAEQGAMQIDIVESSSGGRLETLGLLEHFPPELVEALKEVSRPEAVYDYALEHGNTATMIACNPTIVERCPTNAKEFWDVEGFPADRAITANFGTAFTFALLADGVPRDEILPFDVDRAVAKLEEIRPHIKVWPDSGAMQEQILGDREVGVAYVWNGRAFVVKRDVIPELELYWDDASVSAAGGLSVPKGAPNADVAFEYIRWIAEHPEAQAAFTTALTYPTPTKDLLDLIDPEIAAAMPTSHDPVPLDGRLVAEQEDELQAAWQDFIVGTG